MTGKGIDRRRMLIGAGAALTAAVALPWRHLAVAETYDPLLRIGDHAARVAQRMSLLHRPLAPEYGLDLLTPNHPTNGGFGASYIDPDPAYDRMVVEHFANWRLTVDGLVARPSRFSLDQIRSMPLQSQTTMHCCDEGWSAIGQWSGVPMGWLLRYVGMSSSARYVVLHCMDKLGGQNVFSSYDMFDALHPQTILAHRMNGRDLPPQYGAPLRLRVEMQLGYKNLKHIDRLSVVDSLEGLGHGGLFENYGFQWYAGM